VDIHCYPVGSQTIVLGNNSEDVLGVGLVSIDSVKEIHYSSMMLFMHIGCEFAFCL